MPSSLNGVPARGRRTSSTAATAADPATVETWAAAAAGAAASELSGLGDSAGGSVGTSAAARSSTASSLASRRRCAPRATPNTGAKNSLAAVATAAAESTEPGWAAAAAPLRSSDEVVPRAQSARMHGPVTPPAMARGAYLLQQQRPRLEDALFLMCVSRSQIGYVRALPLHRYLARGAKLLSQCATSPALHFPKGRPPRVANCHSSSLSELTSESPLPPLRPSPSSTDVSGGDTGPTARKPEVEDRDEAGEVLFGRSAKYSCPPATARGVDTAADNEEAAAVARLRSAACSSARGKRTTDGAPDIRTSISRPASPRGLGPLVNGEGILCTTSMRRGGGIRGAVAPC
jgi:hypothetical protein